MLMLQKGGKTFVKRNYFIRKVTNEQGSKCKDPEARTRWVYSRRRGK